jgi:hypothetical protein
MRVFGAIVQALARSMLDRGHDLTPCRVVGTKLVGDDTLRQASLLLHQSQCLRPPIVTTTSSKCHTSFGFGAFRRKRAA